MKIIINPAYTDIFAGFVRSLPATFSHTGKQIYKSRNIIKMFDVDGARLCVKSYQEPIFINRLVYTFFRPSKASRAYYNALEILARGFETPAPVAYIEEKRSGLLSKSYFVCLECPYPTDLRHFAHSPELNEEDRETLRLVGKLNGQLHNREILHLDFSPGNVLYQKIDGEYHFSLLDINRMNFGQVSLKKGCYSFRRLRGSEEMFRIIAQAYAQERGFDVKRCAELIIKDNADHVVYLNRRRKRKQQWRKLWQK